MLMLKPVRRLHPIAGCEFLHALIVHHDVSETSPGEKEYTTDLVMKEFMIGRCDMEAEIHFLLMQAQFCADVANWYQDLDTEVTAKQFVDNWQFQY